MADKNLILIFILMVLLFTGCSGKVDSAFLFEEKVVPPDTTTQAEGKNVNFYSYVPGEVQISFNARMARFDLESNIIHSRDVFFEQRVEEKMTLEARNATFNLDTRQYVFHDDIVYHGIHGTRLYTDYLEIDDINDIVRTNREFVLHTVSGKIIGKGFQADRALTDITISSAYGYEGEQNEK